MEDEVNMTLTKNPFFSLPYLFLVEFCSQNGNKLVGHTNKQHSLAAGWNSHPLKLLYSNVSVSIAQLGTPQQLLTAQQYYYDMNITKLYDKLYTGQKPVLMWLKGKQYKACSKKD
jgi:hypothetical protein